MMLKKNTILFLALCAVQLLQAQTPATPQKPQGDATVCPGGSFVYSIPPVPGATYYLWKAPLGSLVNGDDQLPLTVPAPDGENVWVTFGTTAGQVCVAAGNSDGVSAYNCKSVGLSPIPPTTLPELVLCFEELPYVLNGNITITTPGVKTYTWTLTSVNGCDSIINQKVTVLQIIFRNLGQIYTCTADTGCFYYQGLTLCQEGPFTEYFTSYRGCDSIVSGYFSRLPVTVYITPNAPTLTCLNQVITLSAQTNYPSVSYTWKNGAGQILSHNKFLAVYTPGTYQIFLQGGPSSVCVDSASVVIPSTSPIVNITALPPANPDCQNPKTILQASATPANVVYAWGSTTGYTSFLQSPVVTTSGTYTVTVTNTSTGCTSTKSIAVVSETRRDTLQKTICTGSSYAGYSHPGTYVDTLLTHPCGCYDIRVLTLDSVSALNHDVNVQICAGDQYAGYTQSGVYQDLFSVPGGCDSLRILHLNVIPGFTVNATVKPDNGTGTGSGTAFLDIMGGQGPFHFAWSSGAVEQYLYNLPSGFYVVTVSDALGCSNVLALKVPFQLDSVPPIHPTLGMELFPNPVQNRLWITLPSGTSGHVSLYDVLGNLRLPARKVEAGTSWMEVDELPSGTYFVVLEGAGVGVLVRKVLIYR